MTRSAAAQALVACAREDVVPELGSNETELVRLATWHGLAGRIWRRTRDLPWQNDSAREQLRQVQRRVVERHLAACSTLSRVAEALTALDCEWVTFKGPVFAETAYRSPVDREYQDVDVLVEPPALDEAVRALEERGFTLLDANWSLLSRRLLGELHLASPDGVQVDLHWDLVNRPEIRERVRWRTADVLARSVQVPLQRRTVPTLSAADTLAHLAAHAALGGGHRLVWLTDLDAVVRSLSPEPAEVADRCEQHRVAGAAQVMLTWAHRLLGTPTAGLQRHLGHAGLTALARLTAPDHGRPERVGTSRWLARTAVGGGVQTARAGAAEIRAAVRRRRPSGVTIESVLTPGGNEADRRRFFLQVSRAAGARS